MMNLFNQNSYWGNKESQDGASPPWQILASEPDSEPDAKPADLKHLEDWAHRLETAANEAGDEHLLQLESNLLDLRDEIVFELHQRLL